MTELINSLSFHPSLKIPHLILADPVLRNMYLKYRNSDS